MSKVTSICGTPRGAGGTPSNLKVPRILLSLANCRSPCNTTISTEGCESVAVEKTSVFFVGMVVFREMSTVATPPKVSTPSDNGVTSRSTILDLAGEDSGTHCDDLVGVDALVRLLAAHEVLRQD